MPILAKLIPYSWPFCLMPILAEFTNEDWWKAGGVFLAIGGVYLKLRLESNGLRSSILTQEAALKAHDEAQKLETIGNTKQRQDLREQMQQLMTRKEETSVLLATMTERLNAGFAEVKNLIHAVTSGEADTRRRMDVMQAELNLQGRQLATLLERSKITEDKK